MGEFLYFALGVVLTTIVTVIGTSDSFLSLRDRFNKQKLKKKKEKLKEDYQENHPDYEFRFGYISNPPPGKCILSIGFKNLSNEIKFIEPISYHYEFKRNKNHYLPSGSILDREKWPKRLEHGERFYLSVDFNSFLNNNIYDYWRKNVQVLGKIRTSTEELVRSNAVDFDDLVKFLEPINDNYKKLAIKLAAKYSGSQRDFEASLWQLQIFNRITVHIAKQFQKSEIPIVQYLVDEQDLILEEGYFWSQLDKDLENKKITPNVIINYLESLI